MLELHVLTIFPENPCVTIAGKYPQACAGEGLGAGLPCMICGNIPLTSTGRPMTLHTVAVQA